MKGKRTYQPNTRRRAKAHGFRVRMATKNGRIVLKRRRAKGRKRLTVADEALIRVGGLRAMSSGLPSARIVTAGSQALGRSARVRRRPEFERAYESGVQDSRPLHDGLRHRRMVAALPDWEWLPPESSARRSSETARSAWRASCSGVIKSSAGLDIIIVPRREMLDAPFTSLEADYLALLERRQRSAVTTTLADRPGVVVALALLRGV